MIQPDTAAHPIATHCIAYSGAIFELLLQHDSLQSRHRAKRLLTGVCLHAGSHAGFQLCFEPDLNRNATVLTLNAQSKSSFRDWFPVTHNGRVANHAVLLIVGDIAAARRFVFMCVGARSCCTDRQEGLKQHAACV